MTEADCTIQRVLQTITGNYSKVQYFSCSQNQDLATLLNDMLKYTCNF